MKLTEPRFQFEVFKLLLQAAWADNEIQHEERKILQEYISHFSFSDKELDQVKDFINGKAKLPPPNLGLLKKHRFEVLSMIKELLQSDLNLKMEEKEFFSLIEELLA